MAKPGRRKGPRKKRKKTGGCHSATRLDEPFHCARPWAMLLLLSVLVSNPPACGGLCLVHCSRRARMGRQCLPHTSFPPGVGKCTAQRKARTVAEDFLRGPLLRMGVGDGPHRNSLGGMAAAVGKRLVGAGQAYGHVAPRSEGRKNRIVWWEQKVMNFSAKVGGGGRSR